MTPSYPSIDTGTSRGRTALLFGGFSLLLLLLFFLEFLLGRSTIPVGEVLRTLRGEGDSTYTYVLLYYRLPKAVTALLAGASIAVSGLQMQSLFRNPLADTSVLGINSGAGVGVALYTMAGSLLPMSFAATGSYSVWGTIIASILGSGLTLLLISSIASRMRDLLGILIVGVMIGFLASSVISILQFYSQEETLKVFLLWSFGSISSTTWAQLVVMAPLLLLGLALTLLLPKSMNALLLGEAYARSMGIDVGRARLGLILVTCLLTGCTTAFTGPIAFLGLAVPHFVRQLFRTADHRLLLPATMLLGSILLLLCDLLSQVLGGGVPLPINALTSLIGAPVVLLAILGKRSRLQTFH